MEVHKLKLPRTLYTEYSIADLKLLHSLNEDVTADNIGILIRELEMQKGRTLVEGIKKLWRDKKRITRVPKGVQLLVLTCCVASITEAICEIFGSVMEEVQFFRSPGNNDISCQKHVFISMNGPQMSHCKVFIDWLCDVEYKELKFCTRASLGLVFLTRLKRQILKGEIPNHSPLEKTMRWLRISSI